jgi:serine O-acetyltransferase
MDFFTRLVYARQKPLIGRLAYLFLKFFGVEFPISVKIGKGFILEHGGFGTVIHSKTTIGERVKIYQGVSVGRADIYRSIEKSHFEGVRIDNDAILCPGARVLCKEGVLRVGCGTVIGANAVLLESTGDWEIWAGNPAKCIGHREQEST